MATGMRLGALHPITGRQWELPPDPEAVIWPDACLVVPFAQRVNNATGKVIINSINEGPNDYRSSDQGGWTITNVLQTLELTDLTQDPPKPVAGVTAVWAGGPDGDTPILQVLGAEPFSWLSPHLDAAASASTTSYPLLNQWFGYGPAQVLATPRRFGELVVSPPAGASQESLPRLLTPPHPLLSRILRAPGAGLSFSYPSGGSIAVQEVALGVLVWSEELQQQGLDMTGWSVIEEIPFPAQWKSDWKFALIGMDGSAPYTIPYSGSIMFVRYRHRAATVTSPERITLQPGRYELSLTGTSTGTPPEDFTDKLSQSWSAMATFRVELPPSLRPYVAFATVGDDRLFGSKPGFDPTLPGLGFPAHTGYLPVVRFRVPHLKVMYPTLRLVVDYTAGTQASQTVKVVANTLNETSLPHAAIKWTQEHSTQPMLYDDEVVFTDPFTAGNASVTRDASFSLWSDPADGDAVELDSWGLLVSRFANATGHLAWAKTCITRWYRQDGRHDGALCSPIGAKSGDSTKESIAKDATGQFATIVRFLTSLVRFGRSTEVTTGHRAISVGQYVPQRPDEFDAPPSDWALPATLVELLEPAVSPGELLPIDASQRFLRFLWRTKTSLSKGSGQNLVGLPVPVNATTIEAICDDQDRPYALWLRTPEPIDWRRVNAAMMLRHVLPDGGCPTSYANRDSLALGVDILPSVDGSAALLVARLGGVPTRIPRGEIALTLTYLASVSGLVTLRRPEPHGSDPEKITVTFLQPLGRRWPLPSDKPSYKVKLPPKYARKKQLPQPRPLAEGELFEDYDRLLTSQRGRTWMR